MTRQSWTGSLHEFWDGGMKPLIKVSKARVEKQEEDE